MSVCIYNVEMILNDPKNGMKTRGGHFVHLIDLQTSTFGDVPQMMLHAKSRDDWSDTLGGGASLKMESALEIYCI